MPTREHLIKLANEGHFDDLYAEYLFNHSNSPYYICNSDSLINAMEDGHLWDDFIDYLEEIHNL